MAKALNYFTIVIIMITAGVLIGLGPNVRDEAKLDIPVIHGSGNYSKAGTEIKCFLVRNQKELLAIDRARVPEPVIIFGDGEMGPGVQYSYGPQMPAPMALGSASDIDLTYRFGYWAGQGFRRLGIDAVLAPCVDVFDPSRPCTLGWRCLGGDPDEVARHAEAYALGMRAGGVIPIVKHFPGHGASMQDSHHQVAVIDGGLNSYLAGHVSAFDFLHGKSETFAVLMGHLAFEHSGKYQLATASQHWTRYLRNNLEFDGIIITDSANMGAVQKSSGGESGFFVSALENGCDLILEPSQTRFDYRAFLAARQSGVLSDELLAASKTRLEKFYSQIDELRDIPIQSEDSWLHEGTMLGRELGEKGALAFGRGASPGKFVPEAEQFRLITSNQRDIDLSPLFLKLGYETNPRIEVFDPAREDITSAGRCIIYWRPGSATSLANPWHDSELEWFRAADDQGTTYCLIILGNPLAALPFQEKPNVSGIVVWGRGPVSVATAAAWLQGEIQPRGQWPFKVTSASQ